MPFRDSNDVFGLPKDGPFQVGRSNNENDSTPEQSILLPWPRNPSASYLYFECTVGVVLDSGIVVHNRLPQVESGFNDTLASIPLDDPRLDTITNLGVNLRCKDQYQDIVQRMGHARYWFRLWGRSLRVGYQVPIPGIKTVGKVPAIPYDRNPQWAFNAIAPGGNYSGAILWHAEWSLWYTTAVQPRPDNNPDTHAIKVADPAAHIRGIDLPPEFGIQAPYSQADDSAVLREQ